MKIFNIVFTILFILFAAVQYNDPDPQVWVPIYLFVAATCAYSAMGKYNKTLILIGLIPLTVYMISYIPAFVDWVKMGMPTVFDKMKTENPYIEMTREFGGLVICVAVLGFQYFKAVKQGKY
jgi:Transmembrane family 220, helix